MSNNTKLKIILLSIALSPLVSATEITTIINKTTNNNNIISTPTWYQLGGGSISNAISALTIDSNGNVYAGTYFNIYKTSNSGGIWEQFGGNFKSYVNLLLEYNNELYMGTADNNIYTSSINFADWQKFSNNEVAPVSAVDNNNVYAFSNQHVYKTPINGQSPWHALGGGIIPNNVNINTITLDNNGNLYAGAAHNTEYATNPGQGYVYKTLINGGPWQTLGGGIIPNNGVLSSIALDNNGNVYAAVVINQICYIYVASTSGSGSWQQFSAGQLPSGNMITQLAIDANHGYIYVATGIYQILNASYGGHIYKAPLTGGTWQDLIGGAIPNTNIFSGLVLDSNGNVYAGNGSSVYEYK